MKVSSIKDRLLERNTLSIKTSNIYNKMKQSLEQQMRTELSAIDNQYLAKYNKFVEEFVSRGFRYFV